MCIKIHRISIEGPLLLLQHWAASAHSSGRLQRMLSICRMLRALALIQRQWIRSLSLDRKLHNFPYSRYAVTRSCNSQVLSSWQRWANKHRRMRTLATLSHCLRSKHFKLSLSYSRRNIFSNRPHDLRPEPRDFLFLRGQPPLRSCI